MDTLTFLNQANDEYKQAQTDNGTKPDSLDFNRHFLLELNDADLTAEAKRQCIQCLAPSVKPWNGLKDFIYENYMLDIGSAEKPVIKPCYGCWLDLEKHTISTRRLCDLFSGDDVAVWLPDYRVIDDNIDWKDIAQEGEIK